jgi:hypothetical protein
MKLFDLPRSEDGIKIFADEISDGSSYILFFHIDGMYSYCKTEKGGVIHLAASTPIHKLENGYGLGEKPEMSDSEMWAAHREAGRKHREERRNEATGYILDLIREGYNVEQKSEYHFRINAVLDLYPTRRKWHNLRTGKRGIFRPDHLKSLLNKQLANQK